MSRIIAAEIPDSFAILLIFLVILLMILMMDLLSELGFLCWPALCVCKKSAVLERTTPFGQVNYIVVFTSDRGMYGLLYCA